LLQSHEICFRVHRPLVKYIFIVFTIYQFLWGRFFHHQRQFYSYLIDGFQKKNIYLAPSLN